MIVVLSPAKSLDLDSPLATRAHSQPRLLDQSIELIDILRGKSLDELIQLMKISDELAVLNAARYQDFDAPFTTGNARAAILAFHGDVYKAMDAAGSFDEADFAEAQKTLRILSGLYGVLRPLDLIQPYRLEMGIRLKNPRGRDLYQYWGNRITELLISDCQESPGASAIINLASQEYFVAVNTDIVTAEIVAPRFEETTPSGKRRMVSFYAKRARGTMTGWIVRHRVHDPQQLREFDCDGYRYDARHSTPSQPIFVRPQL